MSKDASRATRSVKPPLLRVSWLSGTVYLITRYTAHENHIIATKKADVTETFVAALAEWKKYQRSARRAKRPSAAR